MKGSCFGQLQNALEFVPAESEMNTGAQDSARIMPGVSRFLALLFCLASGMPSPALHAQSHDLKAAENRALANELLFLLDARDQILTRQQWTSLQSDTSRATVRVFQRILEKRDRAEEKANYMEKSGSRQPSSDSRIFATGLEIRAAALEELFSISSDTVQLLTKSINSARSPVQLGVLRCLGKIQDSSIVKLYEEVMTRDRWGRSTFDISCRREVASSLWRYLDTPGGRRLFGESLRDLDEGVRAVALKSASHAEGTHKSFSHEQLESSLSFESATLLQKLRELDDELDDERTMAEKVASHPELALPLSRSLEAFFEQSPLPLSNALNLEIYIDHPLISAQLIRHHSRIDPALREKILKAHLSTSTQLSLTILSLEALSDADKTLFGDIIVGLVQNARQISVLVPAMKLAGRWKLSACKPSLEKLADHDFRSSVARIARDTAALL